MHLTFVADVFCRLSFREFMFLILQIVYLLTSKYLQIVVISEKCEHYTTVCRDNYSAYSY